MKIKEMEALESKIVDLIDKNNPRPDMLEAIDILDNIKNAFRKYFDETICSSFTRKEKNNG